MTPTTTTMTITDLATAFEAAQAQLVNDSAAQQVTAVNLTKAQAADQTAQAAIVTDKGTIYTSGQTLVQAIQTAIAPFAPAQTAP